MKRIAWLLILAAPFAMGSPYRPEAVIEPPTAYESGDPLDPATDLVEHRLYCDGDAVPLAIVAMPTLTWQAEQGEFSPGSHSCYATAVDLGLNESGASNTVNFTVVADAPVPPSINFG